MNVPLTQADLNILIEALDSHRYWQLSDDQYRDSGNVLEPGSDDPEVCAELAAAELLTQKLTTYQGEAE
jgi:hypothetical protein